MKRQILSVAAALGLSIIAAGQCHAQPPVTVKVPFAFQAGDKIMPAGEYRIQSASFSNEAVQVVGKSDGKSTAAVMTLPVERNGKAVSPRLVFHRYGNEYFLTEIWNGEPQGRHLYQTSREREFASTTGSREVTLLASNASAK